MRIRQRGTRAAEQIESELIRAYRECDSEAKEVGFLCDAYHPRFFYWEVVECVRRLALTGALVFVSDGSMLQARTPGRI